MPKTANVAGDYQGPEIPIDTDPGLAEAIRLLFTYSFQLRNRGREFREELDKLEKFTSGEGTTQEFEAIRTRLLSNLPISALNVTQLIGVLAQPQAAGIPIVTALPTNGQIGEVVSLNDVLYIFVVDATTGPAGQWKVLSTVGKVLVDTHANRIVAAPAGAYVPSAFPVGALFWESDREILYMRLTDGSSAAAWVYVAGKMKGTVISVDERPSDLGTNQEDDNFLFYATDFGITYKWDGTSNWDYFEGRGRIAQTVTADTLIADPNASTRVVPADTPFKYAFIQDATGGWTVTWNAVFKGVGPFDVGRTALAGSVVNFDSFSTTQFVIEGGRADVTI